MLGSLTKARLFGSMSEDEECDYDHILIMVPVHKVVTRKIVVLEERIRGHCHNDMIDVVTS
jgi:hypothetical protein